MVYQNKACRGIFGGVSEWGEMQGTENENEGMYCCCSAAKIGFAEAPAPQPSSNKFGTVFGLIPNRSLDTPSPFLIGEMRLSGILPASVRILFLATPRRSPLRLRLGEKHAADTSGQSPQCLMTDLG